MKLFKKDNHCWVDIDGKIFTHKLDWDSLINREGLGNYLLQQARDWSQVDFVPDLDFDPPLQSQELWAAGVTYLRSREARMDEARDAGGADFYDRVYSAERPELFFKSQPFRVVGHNAEIRIRKDSVWNVPEPELTVFLSSGGSIEGYTIGNDMSSRSIEGENPLYLPQAKTYNQSAALGPCMYIPDGPIDADTEIRMEVERAGAGIVNQSVRLRQMKRTFSELAGWLFREMDFHHGVFLMTGTGIVPPNDFTLLPGDFVKIGIDGIGTLQNTVVQ